MIRRIDISIFFLSAGFFFIMLGSSLGLPFASYFSALCFCISLLLYVNISPKLGLSFLLFCISLSLLSPSPYLVVSLFPLLGFFFAGSKKYSTPVYIKSRYALFLIVCMFYAVYIFHVNESSVGSHNALSIFVTFALIAEMLYFGRPSRLYILLILISFFVLGNRSSIFLLAAFIKNKFLLICFLLVSLAFIFITYGDVLAPSFLQFLFDRDGLLYRSYVELRVAYLLEFIEEFNFSNLEYRRWSFVEVPLTGSGFYDLHNSFLTIIVRDSYLGIFKILLWIIAAYNIPLGLFIAISLRAFHDTFLLGGVVDILLYALVGRSLIKFYHDMVYFSAEFRI